MKNLQELRNIIADAPEGATHITECEGFITYLQCGDYGWSTESESYFDVNEVGRNPLNDLMGIRSLADIRTIVKQAEEIERLRKQTAYLDTCLDIAERNLHDEHFEYYTEEVELLGKNK